MEERLPRTEAEIADRTLDVSAAEGRGEPRVRSAARAVEVLRTVAGADARGISATTLSGRLGIPRQVVYHLAHTLLETGMLRKAGRGSYLLGPGAEILADGLRRQSGVEGRAAVLAEDAARATGQNALVAAWAGGEMVVLAIAQGVGGVKTGVVPRGVMDHAHARAAGKLLLAMADGSGVDRYLEAHGCRRRTSGTITTRKALELELERIRGDWVSLEREEFGPDLFGVAVPMGSASSDMVVGISCGREYFVTGSDACVESLRRLSTSSV